MPTHFLDKIFGRTGNRMFQMAYIYAQMRDGLIPDLYIQDPRYFDKYEEEIKQLFGSDIPPLTDKVSIHVRRTDYVNNPFYADLSKTDYYGKAIAKFPDDKFLVFSDDIDWCKHSGLFDNDPSDTEHEPVIRFEFSDLLHEEALFKMASCKHNVIANSSFSWWAAYLNPNPQKTVIYPKAWYSDGVERTKCPESWICV